MPIYEVDVGGKTYEVDAPDPNTAWQWANYTDKNAPPEPGFFSNIGQLLVKGGKQTLGAAEVAPSVIAGGDVAAKSKLIAEQLGTTVPEPKELKDIKGAFKEEGKAWEEAQGFMQGSKAIGEMLYEVGRQAITNPKGLMYMTAEQAANMAPSIAGMIAGGKGGALAGTAIAPGVGTAIGAGVGAIGGAFAGQAPVEIGSEFIGLIGKELNNRGLAPTEANVQALMQDKEFLQKAISEARTKGTTTAAIDAATTALGGKVAGGAKSAAIKAARTELGATADVAKIADRANEIMASRTIGQKVGRGAAGVGLDVAGGGISEAGGQLAAYGKVDLEDVALEILGELGGSAVEVPLAARSLRTPGLPSAITPPAPPAAPVATTPPPPAAPPAAAPPAAPAAPSAEEAQDTAAMLREILAQTEEKPPVATGKPAEPKVTPEPVTPPEVSTFGTEVKQVTPPPAPPAAPVVEAPAIGKETIRYQEPPKDKDTLYMPEVVVDNNLYTASKTGTGSRIDLKQPQVAGGLTVNSVSVSPDRTTFFGETEKSKGVRLKVDKDYLELDSDAGGFARMSRSERDKEKLFRRVVGDAAVDKFLSSAPQETQQAFATSVLGTDYSPVMERLSKLFEDKYAAPATEVTPAPAPTPPAAPAPAAPSAVTPTPIQVFMGLEDASTESLKDGPVKDALLASDMINGKGILTPKGRDLLGKIKPAGLSARQPSSEEAEAMIRENVLQPALAKPAAPAVEAPKTTSSDLLKQIDEIEKKTQTGKYSPLPTIDKAIDAVDKMKAGRVVDVPTSGWMKGQGITYQEPGKKPQFTPMGERFAKALKDAQATLTEDQKVSRSEDERLIREALDKARAKTEKERTKAVAEKEAKETEATKEAEEKAKAQQDLEDALGDLSMLLSKPGRMNIVPEDEQKLLPILTRIMDAAFRLGKIKFKEASRFVMDTIRSKLGDEVADQITLDHLQGSYIGMAGKYQDQGASSKKEVIEVESMDEIEEREAPSGIESAVQFSRKEKMAQEIGDKLSDGASFKTIVEARDQISKITGEKIEPGTKAAKDADEAIEAGVIIAARNIIEEGRFNKRSTQEIYDELVGLYNRQPNLSVRSSTSVANQAYSTPAPLAYVASELAGITNKTTVLEPTAGNGMLLIAANPDKVRANELDPDRARMLETIMFGADISQENALEMEIENNSFDVVIANPPFGKAGEISNIDHDIVLKSLVGLKEDGRAVLIVGGVQATTEEGRREGYRNRAKREFYYELYNLYNVVDHFTAGGNLYAKQGTTYPVDVIVIDGVGKSSRDLPAAELPQLITTYEQLKEKLNEPMVSGEDRGTGRADSGVSAEGEAEREGVDRGAERPSGGPGAEGRKPAGGGERGVSEARPTERGEREPGGRGAGEVQPEPADVSERGAKGEPVAGAGERAKRAGEAGAEGRGPGKLGGVSVVSGERVGSGLAERRGLETETENQVAYYPHSQANSVGTLVPKAMADSIENSLAKIESSVGDLDNYVAESLEMDPETVRELFSAEQVDALALAINNAEAGKGFIIGDQTGVGKGRVVAAMMRYALVNDKTPIFVTEKPNLYSDMIRDLDDIGMTKELALDTAKPKIFITNGSESIPYTLLRKKGDEITENNLILKAPKSGAALDGMMKSMMEKDSLGDYKVIFTTYSQLQTVKGKETERQKFINQFAAGNYMIFDESHNAGGAGETQARTKEQREKAKAGESLATGRASFVRNLVSKAYGTFFSSATYAKRPDVMDLYSSTDMSLAVDKISELAEAIKGGGIPMQQTVAQMLTQVGQYIRRERTFAGVSYDTQETKVDKETAENMATSMRDILAFSRAKELAVKDIQKQMDRQGAKIGMEGEKTKVQSANFGSIMHNLIDQMLLSLKAQESVRHAIERLKAGEKVVMTVSNTMGSFLKTYADDMNLNVGDPVTLSFKDLYIRYLEKQRILSIKHPGGRVEEYRLTDNDLGPALVQQYEEIKTFIENAGFGSAPISPIDYMHAELRKAKVKDLNGVERNVKTEEITGRTMTLNYEGGRPILTSRTANIKQRVNAVKAFNSGAADVIILNQAGSTGLSLHASNKFIDTRKRHMIIVQAEKNIDTHMQMLGRVHRTGQVIPPAYSQMMADIPAEMRPAAILLKKMASLNANTTASRKSAVSAEGAVDFMNEYGGQVAQEYLRDNPEVYEALGGKKILEIMEDPSEANEDDIRRLTGYIPILPIKQQEEVYKDLVERYNDLIEREDSMGTNKLEAKAVDLDAKTIASAAITEDKGDPSVFAKPAIMEKVDVKRTVKPYSKDEVKKQVEESLDGEKAGEKAAKMWHELSDRVKEYGRPIIQKMEEEAEPDRIKIENTKSQLNAQYTHAKTILTEFPIGSPVVVKHSKGMLVKGVVTDVQNKMKTKNPAAGSDWKMTIALADGDAKSITMTFSQIGSTYQLKKESETAWFNPTTDKFEYIPMLDLFDKGATVRREKRWMVTGNILAGFAAVNNMGQIITYTKDDGTTAQGILMPRTFDFEKAQKNADVRLKNLAAVMDFFNTFGRNAEVSTPEWNLKIAYMGNSEYRFVTPSSKREGGTFYLDKSLTDITGDFYKSGQIMRAMVYSQDKANEAIQYLLSDRGETLIAYNNKDKAREMFAPKVPLANVQPDFERESLSATANFVADRETLIRKYQSLRQKRGAIMRKFKKGETGLDEQEAINTIDEIASQIKDDIASSKVKRTDAKNFFARATREWNDGNISDDVYAAIKTMYEKYPMVLEGLNLSVKKQPEDSNAAGQFFSLARLVRLYKGTNGVQDPSTIRHEITHGLEQMMSADAVADLIMDWSDKLGKAIKKDVPEARPYFRAVLEFFENPSIDAYKAAVALMPSYDYYQYINPSEYWAVNAEKLMARKLGTGWDRFVLAAKRLFEGLKYMFGFDNQYIVQRTFNDIMSSKGERFTKAALNDYVEASVMGMLNLDENTRRNYKGKPAPLSTWDSPEMLKLDNWAYRWQDKHIDTKRVVQAVTKGIGDIADRFDAYLKETLYHGRVAKQTMDFLKRDFRPFIEKMAKMGVKVDEFEFYLHNRHAVEYNELIASRNAGMADKGSGIETDEAVEYFNNLSAEDKKKYEELAKDVDKFVAETQDMLVENGLETQERIDSWRDMFKHYVPLKRDPNELDFVNPSFGMGKGFAIKGDFSRTATGSLKTVVDILNNIALQREMAIVRSEKARVGRALYGMALQAPNPEFWMPINPDAIKNKKKLIAELQSMGLDADTAENILQEPRTPRIDKKTGMVEYSVNPAMRNMPNVFPVRINGKDRFIIFNPADPRAKRMVEALKNMDAHQLENGLDTIAELTRLMAAMNTQFNPVFGAWNFVRDVESAAVNLTGTSIADKRMQVVADAIPALKAIYRDLRGKTPTNAKAKEWIDLYERFANAGGQTGYREQFTRAKDKATLVKREMARLDRSNVRKVANAVADWLSDYNDAMENAVRLSAFKAALENGLSEDRAAELAKNLTVNFNRKGSWTTNANAFYAFLNASVQGSARMAQLIFKRDDNGKVSLTTGGKSIIAGGMMIGAMQAALLAIFGFDADEPPEFLKNKNLIIPTGSGNYLIVPMPLGLNVFPNTARIVTEYALTQAGAMTGKRDLPKTILSIGSAVLDAFNPLGSSGLIQTLSPTLVDPFVAIAENKDAFGRPISKENRATNPTPGYERSRDNASAISKGLAYGINYLTGGGKYGIGAYSPTADDIDYVFSQYVGGLGREASKAVGFVKAKAEGEETPPYKVPILGKAYGETQTPSAVSDKFYKNVTMLAELEGEMKRMREKRESLTEFMKDNPEYKFIQNANNLENQISRINKTIKEIQKRPETEQTKAQIERFKEQKTRMMNNFNERVKASQRQ
jgi:uncharacterized membrane protein